MSETLGLYILENGKVKPAESLEAWALWFKDVENRRLVTTHFPSGDVLVSTVFLGIDHGFFDALTPVLFETMIFGGEQDNYQRRYTTLEDALAGHDEAVRLVSGENPTTTSFLND